MRAVKRCSDVHLEECLQTDFSQGRNAIDTQLVLKHIPKAQ